MEAILDRLEKDTSNDVQTMAVKCLSVLVTRANEASVREVTKRLCKQLIGGRAELRDVYGIGLKTLVERVHLSFAPAICDESHPRLLEGIEATDLAVRGLVRCCCWWCCSIACASLQWRSALPLQMLLCAPSPPILFLWCTFFLLLLLSLCLTTGAL